MDQPIRECPAIRTGKASDCPMISSSHRIASIWKSIALILIGVCGSGAVSWATYVRTAMSRDEVRDEIIQYNSNVKDELNDLKAQNAVMEKDIKQLEIHTARISEHLGLADK